MKFFNGRSFKIAVAFLFVVSFVFIALPGKSLAATWEKVQTGVLGDVTTVRLVSFNSVLYASTGNATTGVKIMKSTDGVTWTQANTSGFGTAGNIDAVMVVHNSALYVGTDTIGGTAQLWRTTGGTNWTQIGPDGFGDANNYGIAGLGEFNNKLYIGLNNGISGAEVFRLDNTSDLTQVNLDGFDGTNANDAVWAMQEYNGALYASTGQGGGSAQIWKTTNGTTWSAVMQGGFGDTNNIMITTLFSFNGALYAGTDNTITGTEVWRTTTSDSAWEQVNADGFGSADSTWSGDQVAVVNGTIYLGARNIATGAKLFTSTNGSTWTQEGASGFGEAANFAIYAITFNGRIYLGFTNMAGAQIWRTTAMDILSVTTTSIGDEMVGGSYVTTLTANAGTAPLAWSITSGSLPDGESLSSTGIISGTPTKSGTYTFTVTVVDSGNPQQTASRELSIKVNDAPATLPETGADGYFNWAGSLL